MSEPLMSALMPDSIEPMYDEASKPFPNSDEHFLGVRLGLTVDPIKHIRQLGNIDDVTLKTMRAACIQEMTHQLQYYAGWDASPNDKRHHPNGDSVVRCVAKWKSQGIGENKSFLRPVVSNKEFLNHLDTTYLLCDFLGFHNDVNLAKDKNRGTIAVLLNAPYGCKFVTNEQHETVAEIGGIYLMDDLYGHAVFPTEKMPTVDAYKLHLPKYDDYRDYVANNMAMCFALISYYYHDQH